MLGTALRPKSNAATSSRSLRFGVDSLGSAVRGTNALHYLT